MQPLSLGYAVAMLGGLAASAALAAGPPPPADLVQARVVAEDAAIAPGTTLWVDVHLEVKQGWHIYWRNPGDAGLPTTIDWTVPPGFSAGEMQWPVPERFVTGKIGDYGYRGAIDLLVPIVVPPDLSPGGSAAIEAAVSWLACADICIPGDAKVGLTLATAQSAEGDPGVAALFAAARAKLPQPAPFATHFTVEPAAFRLLVPEAAGTGLDGLVGLFFPNDRALLDHAAAPTLHRTADGIELVLPRAGSPSANAAASPATLDGVLELRGGDGTVRAFTVSAAPQAAPAPGADERPMAWWRAVLLAFFGGIVLNLMPCVFPILSLKVLGLARPAHAERAERRRHGLAYTAGVLVSFALLGTLLLSLRAGGAAVGWGFQLQSPVVVALLAYLLMAMGLSLSGVADFGMALANAGGRLSQHSSLAGAFGTGVLATVVATPCTAPFMGAALGVALIAPAAVAFGIFIALGAGLATPFLLATWVPGLHRLLPRPGRWMERVKQLLAFGLYGTVAWLVWVLIQEIGPGQSLGALFGLVLVGFAVWIYGLTRFAAPRARLAGSALAVTGAAAAILMSAMIVPRPAEPATSAAATTESLPYQPFTPARLTALASEHKPVFVNLTAAWCITCLVNERVILDSEVVRTTFAAHGIVPLKGDWTNQNPDITRLLLRFGRSGVPLYLLYDSAGTPQILPQILTEASVLEAVKKL